MKITKIKIHADGTPFHKSYTVGMNSKVEFVCDNDFTIKFINSDPFSNNPPPSIDSHGRYKETATVGMTTGTYKYSIKLTNQTGPVSEDPTPPTIIVQDPPLVLPKETLGFRGFLGFVFRAARAIFRRLRSRLIGP